MLSAGADGSIARTASSMGIAPSPRVRATVVKPRPAPRILPPLPMTLAPGSRLGPYEIAASIGVTRVMAAMLRSGEAWHEGQGQQQQQQHSPLSVTGQSKTAR